MGLKIIIITVINGHNLRELKLMTLFLRDENLDIFVFQVIDAFMQLLIHDTTGLCAFSSDVAQRMLVDGKSASEIIPWLRNDAENAQRLVWHLFMPMLKFTISTNRLTLLISFFEWIVNSYYVNILYENKQELCWYMHFVFMHWSSPWQKLLKAAHTWFFPVNLNDNHWVLVVFNRCTGVCRL